MPNGLKRHILKGCQNSLKTSKEFWQSFARLCMGSFKWQGVKMDNYIVSGPSTVEASNSRHNDVVPSNSSQTRKRFRPTAHELSILQADHQLDYRSTLAERSREFGVTEKKILNWHKRYKMEWLFGTRYHFCPLYTFLLLYLLLFITRKYANHLRETATTMIVRRYIH